MPGLAAPTLTQVRPGGEIEALEQAGASLKDVVRARYFVVDAADWPRVAPIFGQYFSHIRPASTAVVCGLVDPRMKIEIEVTARKPG